MVKKRYFWKVLSQDGLLKEPREVGPNSSSRESLNDCNGFDSEDEAVRHLEAMAEKYKGITFYGVPGSLVLITEYDTR